MGEISIKQCELVLLKEAAASPNGEIKARTAGRTVTAAAEVRGWSLEELALQGLLIPQPAHGPFVIWRLTAAGYRSVGRPVPDLERARERCGRRAPDFTGLHRRRDLQRHLI
jgi:hypothetical protein